MLLILLLPTLFYSKFTFALNGDKVIDVDYNTEYQEQGVTAKICKLFKCKNIEKENKIIENNYENELGTYKTIYKEREYILERTIQVVDKEKNIIKLNGNENITLALGAIYTEPGFEAMDNYDDLKNEVTIESNQKRHLKQMSFYNSFFNSST